MLRRLVQAGGIAVAMERQARQANHRRRHAGTSSSRWSERAPHRRKLLGLAPMGPPARTGLDETRA